MTGAGRIIIAGAGGLGVEVALYARDAVAAGRLGGNVAGFIDDEKQGCPNGLDLPVLSAIDAYRSEPGDRVVIAVGDPAGRRLIADRLARGGARFVSVVHPLAWVAPLARLGDGCVVAPFATIGPRAHLAAHVLVNTHAGIGHDCVLGACAAVSPHAVVNGWVRLGEQVMVGSGAVVVPGQQVGDRARISAGSVVQAAVADDATVWGNPARPLPRPPQP